MSSVRQRQFQPDQDAREREERRELLASLNDRIAAAALRHHFASRIPFHCECAAPECQELALHTLSEYEQRRADLRAVLAPGHGDPAPRAASRH